MQILKRENVFLIVYDPVMFHLQHAFFSTAWMQNALRADTLFLDL